MWVGMTTMIVVERSVRAVLATPFKLLPRTSDPFASRRLGQPLEEVGMWPLWGTADEGSHSRREPKQPIPAVEGK